MALNFFLTHSWHDREFAQKLCNDLRAKGLQGFLDVYSVKPGDDIPREINRGLEACDVYIPILSFEALKSRWCEHEISAALMLSKEPDRDGRPRIIPVLAEDCRSALPPLLKPLLYIDFAARYPDALEDLLLGISHLHLSAERAQGELGVIARRHRLTDDCRPSCLQSRQQDRALDLRARHERVVSNAVEQLGAGAMDHERGISIIGGDEGAHSFERFGHPTHRPPAQRGIARDPRHEWLSGQHARQQAHRGPGVLRVQHERRAGKLESA